ncbi:MAG: hypothetical protein RIR26_334 [Pseudomonadota bacterium]|jgi:Zn-dependent peptidase ImmA (M78 family)
MHSDVVRLTEASSTQLELHEGCIPYHNTLEKFSFTGAIMRSSRTQAWSPTEDRVFSSDETEEASAMTSARPVFFALALSLFGGLAACVSRDFNLLPHSVPQESTLQHWGVHFEGNAADSINLEQLEKNMNKGVKSFETEIAPLKDHIWVAIGGPSCLRTGYQFDYRKIVFCNNTNTVERGTRSLDVINHELFHALLCQSKPQWCQSSVLSNSESIAVHEALADVFAYLMSPDDSFGENFYADRPFVRPYKTKLCQSLSEGEHERGNALASALIESGATLTTLSELIKTDTFGMEPIATKLNLTDPCLKNNGPHIAFLPEGKSPSELNRYRVNRGEPIKFRIDMNDALKARYPQLTLRLETTPKYFAMKEERNASNEQFLVFTPKATQGVEKITAYFLAEGIVASRTLFLAIGNSEL